MSHIDPNTNTNVNLIQVQELNLIQLQLYDIYGNAFNVRSNVSFTLTTTDPNGNIYTFMSYFNDTLSANVISVDLTLADNTQFVIKETTTSTILQGAFNSTVLAGPAYIPYFTLAEENSATGGFCFVGNPCKVIMNTFDFYMNQVKNITIYDPTSDFDAFVLGPIEITTSI